MKSYSFNFFILVRKLIYLSCLLIVNISVKAQLAINKDSLSTELSKCGYKDILFVSFYDGLGFAIEHTDPQILNRNGEINRDYDIYDEAVPINEIDKNDSATIVKTIYGNCDGWFKAFALFQKDRKAYILKLDYCNNYNIIPLPNNANYLYFLKYRSIIPKEKFGYANPDFLLGSPTPLYALTWYINGTKKEKIINYGSFFTERNSKAISRFPIIKKVNALHASIFMKRLEAMLWEMEDKKLFTVASKRQVTKTVRIKVKRN